VKLAHLADLHLGFRQYTRLTPQGINQREADVARAFRSALDGVIEAKPDVIVLAGDVFDSVRPPNPAILDAFNQFRRLRGALPQVPVIILAGDHDTPRSIETGTILKLFEAIPNTHVMSREVQTLEFEALELAVTGVPAAALLATGGGVRVAPVKHVRWNVRVQHSRIAGMLPGDDVVAEHGGVLVEPGDLQAERWNYIALGHYHVAQAVRPNAWFSGALEYVTRNPWREIAEGDRTRRGHKGWLLVDLQKDGVDVAFHAVPLARKHMDLEPIHAQGLEAEDIDRLIAKRVDGVKGGIDEQVVRQLVYDVPRHILRDLNHAKIREYKTRALHFRFDPRRPEPVRQVGIGVPGRRQTLPELLDEYLANRPLPADVDRDALISLGRKYLNEVESDIAET
jgi:DNA repair exonuclease SbcCD nuclease subunit